MLNDPEILALAAASPAAGRALRPLCHILGLRPPPALRRPKRPDPAPDPAPDPVPARAAVPSPYAAQPVPASGPDAAARPAHFPSSRRDRRNAA
ncbi:hypothetical protein [Acidiphilium sp.]|uniref:hypothetical protein n=1 Tax=Acidiphilium sp. TaxID=527 RepID=UPI00258DC482|nr:hypothetical protein [Acidiphilium sp.]